MERLTGLDAGFLYMETPTLLMHTLKIAVLEPAPGIDDLPLDWLRERIGERLHLLPPFRRRLVEVPFHFHHPLWIEDPDFNIEYHIRRVTVAAPGTSKEMDETISEIAGRPLDRSKPLWELYVLDGLENDRIGVLVKIHHAAADGVAASQLLANVMTTTEADVEASAPSQPWIPELVPAKTDLLVGAFRDHLRQLARLPSLLLHTLKSVIALVRHRRTTSVNPPRPILDSPRTVFNAGLTSNRVFATTSLSLAEVKTVKMAFGVTVNDVILAIVGGALRAYLARRGELPDRPLIAGVPVSTDAPEAVARLGGNRVSNLFTTLATDEADPLKRLATIHEVTAESKVVQNLLGADMMLNWVQYTPPGPYTWFMRQYSRFNLADRHPPALNLVVSNVPGPRETLFVAGARLEELYSVGPVLEGIGINITVWSYRDRLFVGILGCRETAPDARGLLGDIESSLAELLDLVPLGVLGTDG